MKTGHLQSGASGNGKSLREKVEEKIALLKAVEEEMPSITIVHSLMDRSVVYMSPRGLKILGVTMEELVAMGEDYHARFFNMEFFEGYAPKIFGLLERNIDDEVISFFQQVRASEQEDWNWYLSCTKIFMRDEEGKPLYIITNAVPMEAQHHIAVKAERLLNENSFLRKHHHIFSQLTKREKEILKLMAMGLSSSEIAEELHISEMTATTHRKNIRNKLNAKNNYDITRFAQAFDLI